MKEDPRIAETTNKMIETTDERQRRQERLIRRYAASPKNETFAEFLKRSRQLLADRNEELDLALRLATEARRLDDSPAILDTLGWVHLKRGETGEAIAALEQAVAALPDVPSVRYRLGIALSKDGRTQLATETLRAALDAGSFPEVDAARQELAQLGKK